jgi:hypothetical protein
VAAPAQEPVGAEFPVNAHTTGSQAGPAIAVGAAGDFVVVWQGSGPGDGLGVFGRRYDSSGAAQGAEFQVNSYTAGTQLLDWGGLHSVAMDGDGRFVVAWHGQGSGDGEGVFARRFASDGTPLGDQFLVNSTTPGRQWSPSVSMDPAGDFVVSWHSGDFGYCFAPADLRVMARRFDPAGNPVGDEVPVAANGQNVQFGPAAAIQDPGRFVVVWSASTQTCEYVYGECYCEFSGHRALMRRFDAAGTPGPEVDLLPAVAGARVDPGAVAASAAGPFVVVWSEADAGGDRVAGRSYDSAGSPLAGPFVVNTYTPLSQAGPDVALDESGGFVVTWQSGGWGPQGQDGSSWGVFGRRFQLPGNPASREFQVNTYTPNRQMYSAVGLAGTGDFVVAWESGAFSGPTQDGSYYGVFGQRFRRPDLIFADGFP